MLQLLRTDQKMSNSVFKVTFTGICPSLACVRSIDDYILYLQRIVVKTSAWFQLSDVTVLYISSFLKAVG